MNKTSNFFRPRFIFCLGMVVVTLYTQPLAANCYQWGTNGYMFIVQGDGRYLSLSVQQDGNVVTGQARYTEEIDNGILIDDRKNYDGTFDGTIEGSTFTIQMFWETNRVVGIYTGQVGPQGRIEGQTYDRARPGNTVSWYSAPPLKCLQTSAPTEAPPKVARKIGKGTPKSPPIASTDIVHAKTTSDTVAAVSQSDACATGFVWREASANDHVCVTPESRSRTSNENVSAKSRWNATGAYGPNTCISGYVWREAYPGDQVCVTPQVRDLVREENQLASRRKAN